MLVTVSGVFLVIRARFVEEKNRILLENSAKMTDDVTTSSSDKVELLEGQKEAEDVSDERVGITFALDKFSSVWVNDSDEDKDGDDNEQSENNFEKRGKLRKEDMQFYKMWNYARL